MSDPIRVGLAGLRHLHPPAYLPLFGQVAETEVVGAAEPDARAREAFHAEHGLPVWDSVEALLTHGRLDLVAVFVPHDEMPGVCLQCAERGVHVLVEKPLATTSAEARRLVEGCRAAGVQVTAPYVWRRHPVAQEMKQRLADGLLGAPVSAVGQCVAGGVERYRAAGAGWLLDPRQSGGGPMHNLGVHWIDLFRWLLDDEVAEVTAETLSLDASTDLEDHCTALLTFRGGAVLTLEAGYTAPASVPFGRLLHLEVRGTRGVLSWSPGFEGVHETLSVCSDDPRWAEQPARELAFDLEPCPGYFGSVGLAYVREVALALQEGRAVPLPAENGVAALTVVEAIYESARTGRRVALSRQP